MGMFDEVLENVGEPFKGASKGFEYGTHEVILMQAEGKQKKTKANDAAEVIEVTVADEVDEEKTATCTLYFHTEGGAKMSVAKVLGILVHNVGEDKKDTVRELGRKMFGSIDDPVKARNVAVKLLNDKMIGKKAYLVAEPQGRYKTTSYGDLWHYPAEPQGEPVFEAQAATKATGGAVADITEDELPEFGDL
jgi:hypothetical protein